MTTKTYPAGEIDIIWQPDRCIHAGVCVRTLPEVYRPRSHPWIVPGKATTDQLKAQIDRCPSGALSYRKHGG